MQLAGEMHTLFKTRVSWTFISGGAGLAGGLCALATVPPATDAPHVYLLCVHTCCVLSREIGDGSHTYLRTTTRARAQNRVQHTNDDVPLSREQPAAMLGRALDPRCVRHAHIIIKSRGCGDVAGEPLPSTGGAPLTRALAAVRGSWLPAKQTPLDIVRCGGRGTWWKPVGKRPW